MKHTLNIESLEVESYSTVPEAREPGTAQEFCPTFCYTCRTGCSCPATP